MEVELDEVQWRAPEFVRAMGLRTDNVLDYFALSPFFDRSSNNQVLKMQSNYNELQMQNLSDRLQNMKGIEFVVAYAQEPDLWIIRKQNRHSPSDAEIIATYFVVGENIHQAPSVYGIVASRLLASTLSLKEGFSVAQQLPQFSAANYNYLDDQNYQKQSKHSSAKIVEEPKEEAKDFERSFDIALKPAQYLSEN